MAEQRSLVVRAVWFLLIGWWLTGLWLSLAWACVASIVGLPVGIWLIDRVPLVLSLKRRSIVEESGEGAQAGLLTRAVWFVFVGWWLSGIWTSIAYLFTVTIVGLPVAIWMYDRLPFVVSLYRY